MSDDLVERLSGLHKSATPAELETAEIKEGQDWFVCPHCDGAGEVEAEQYINYDGVAANVLFSGIGHEVGANRDWYMEVTRAWPSVADEITRLRASLEKAERERDNYNAMYEQALITATQLRKYGFRAGIEAAGSKDFLRPIVEEQSQGEWDDKTIDEDVEKFSAAIRALSPADNTTTVADAAKVICDAWDADTLPVNDPDPMLPSFIAALRALAAQKGE